MNSQKHITNYHSEILLKVALNTINQTDLIKIHQHLTPSRLGLYHVTFHSYLIFQSYARQLKKNQFRALVLGVYSVLIPKDLVGCSLTGLFYNMNTGVTP